MTMLAYSALLTLALTLSAPWWLIRMATTDRYREGLKQRLGFVPAGLRAYAANHRVVWLHAVSVGEVLAASRLITELEAALGEGWRIVISTTTRTGHALAKQRFGTDAPEHDPARIFYLPLDFAFATRAYLNALRPAALILMESELWPRLLHECRTRNIPVAVANARVSDRSFRRAMKVRALWKQLVRKPTLWLAQSDEDARRLSALGARIETIQNVGNLKYDIRAAEKNSMAKLINELRGASRLVVAGSTLANEEALLLEAWPRILRAGPDMILLIAPRHPERFSEVFGLIQQSGYKAVLCSELNEASEKLTGGTILLLDTIGDLASVYSVAVTALIGGSLIPKGGHNPLEAAQFGVPILMGPFYENFRDIVEGLKQAWAIGIVAEDRELSEAVINFARHGKEWGERAKGFYSSQTGATARTVTAILSMMQEAKP
jgi:3-deoxy-D-manno-octulosonic-acid transferase